MSLTELEERVAKLNTQLRFGRLKPALLEAYGLRTFIQLNCILKGDALKELQRAERVISELEGRNAGGVQRLIKGIIRVTKASLNPTDGTEKTLLDRFRDTHSQDHESSEGQDSEDRAHVESSQPPKSTEAETPLGDGEWP